MGLFGLFKKKSDETKVGNVEDFISLTRVYFQSVIATNLGITNIRFLPDVANFKRLFKIPTQGGKLGLAEKSASRKMLMQDYGLNESFFKEIDSSVKRNCRTQNVYVSGILQRLDDVDGESDAMEVPYAVYIQEGALRDDAEDGTRCLYEDGVEG